MGFWTPSGVGGHVSAQVPGVQAGMERAIGILFGVLAGQTSFGAFGSLADGDVGSIVQLMIDLEIAEWMKRMIKGINVTEETLAAKTIIKAGIGASFLNSRHTVKHFRKELWFPDLMDRRTAAAWSREPKFMLENARDKARLLIRTAPNRSKLDETQIRDIKKVVERADREIAGND